jgi:ABC-type dipeptide/oligopeptide/nickel transport system ATPase component
MSMFQKATKEQSKLRMALIGPSGSGKTYTALKIACELGQKIAVIDSERGSASKYADLFAFDCLDLEEFSPQRYIQAIEAAGQEGYDVVIVDSLSHAWMGKGGALEQVDNAAKRSQSKNSFAAWREVTPLHNQLVDTILQSPCHVIATMRTKTEYVIEKNDQGKSTPRKIGLAPVQRDGLEYEFDVVADMQIEGSTLVVSKTRCPALNEFVVSKPGKEVADKLIAWLSSGGKPKEQPTRDTGEIINEPATSEPVAEITPEQKSSIVDLMTHYELKSVDIEQIVWTITGERLTIPKLNTEQADLVAAAIVKKYEPKATDD